MKIAVIGSGISGLGAALALSERHDVRLFEKDARFGGHANTAVVDYDGEAIAVDTGFIVFNTKNYPNLTSLFDHLGVASENSDMSFGVSVDNGRLEYACDGLDKIFAQRWRVLDPSFWGCFADIMRFNREAPAALASGALDGLSLGDWLAQRGFRRQMREHFIIAMGAAIWSTPAREIVHFPARAFVQFFVNHELMTGLAPAIQWRTVTGGSRRYVDRVVARLADRAQCGVGARSVTRLPGQGVRVRFTDGSDDVFDHVVLATHSDQALEMLVEPTPAERRLLGALRFSKNKAVLHRDPSFMPKRRKVWSSWSVQSSSKDGAEAQPATLTYWMNRLQNLDRSKPLFVTLNPQRDPDPALTFGSYAYDHPLYDQAAFDAQIGLDRLQGDGGVWYAGAWLGWGFHEDGLKAGLRVAAALGAQPGWVRGLGDPLAPAMATAA